MIRRHPNLTALLAAACLCLTPAIAHAQAGIPYSETPAEEPPAVPAEAELAKDAEPAVPEPSVTERETGAITPTVASQPELYGLSPGELTQAWRERLKLLHDGDTEGADALLEKIVEAKVDSGWPNASAVGLAAASEALEAMDAGAPERAVSLAESGRRLARLEPRAHLAEARTLWAAGDLSASVKALVSALRVSWSNPWELRMRLANMAVGASFALLVALALFAIASVYRHFGSMRYWLSGVLPTGFSKSQATIIVATALFLPLVLGVGLVWTILYWSVAGALFYSMRERAAAALVIVYLTGLPYLVPFMLQPIGYTGSRAHDAYLAATDIGAEAAAARLAAHPKIEPEELFILGLRSLWSGDIDLAAKWLHQAADRDDSTPELYVSLGNIEYARGNLDEATEVYNVAINRDPENVMALFNLSRLKFSQTEQQEAGELHRRANEIDYVTVERWSEEAKRIGPTYVVRPTVPSWILDRGHADEGASRDAALDLWSTLSGGTNPQAFLIGAAIAFLWLMLGALFHRRAERSERKGGGQALERIRHEIEVHRHQARIERLRKIFAMLFAGAGQLICGRSVKGILFATVFLMCLLVSLTTLDLLPRLVPYDGGPKLFALVLAFLIGLAAYGLSLWDNARWEG